jgi:hypothetical protein
MKIVIIDSRKGQTLDPVTTEAMEDAAIVCIIEADGHVRALPGEGPWPAVIEKDRLNLRASFHTAVTEAELSAMKAREDLARRQAKYDPDVGGEPPLVKAYRALGAPADFEPPPMPS